MSFIVLTVQVSSAIEFTTSGLSSSGLAKEETAIVSAAAPLVIKTLSSFGYNVDGPWPWFLVDETLGFGTYFEAVNSGNVTIKTVITNSSGTIVGQGKNTFSVSNDGYFYYVEGGAFTGPGMYKITFKFIYNGAIRNTISTKVHVF
jgi:hypothetical protein